MQEVYCNNMIIGVLCKTRLMQHIIDNLVLGKEY